MLQMATGIDLHHKILRAALKECQGYEVATEGDSFKCAFGTPGGCIPTHHVLPAITAQVANRAARVSLAARQLNNAAVLGAVQRTPFAGPFSSRWAGALSAGVVLIAHACHGCL